MISNSQSMMKNCCNSRTQCIKRSQPTNCLWTIKLHFSRKCTQKLLSWSTET